MKACRLVVLGTAAVLLFMLFGTADAQDAQQPKRDQKQRPRGFFGRGFSLLGPDAVEKLKLSSEQKEKFDKIVGEFQEKQKASGAQLREVFQSKDRDKIREALQKMRESGEKLRNEYLGKVEGLLNADQKAVFAEVKNQRTRPNFQRRPGGAGQGGLQRLNLTEEQREKIRAIQQEAREKIQNILTEEQKKQLQELQKRRPGADSPRRRPRPNQDN